VPILYLGYIAGSTGSYNLSSSAYLTAGTESIGNSGSGSFTQGGGTNSASTLYFGYNPNSNGLYTLSGGLLVSPSGEYVGNSASGTFAQSGGTNNASGGLVLAQSTNGVGAYNLSGSGYLSAENEIVGSLGSGSFTQGGGTNSAALLYVGYAAGSSGGYTEHGTYISDPATQIFSSLAVAAGGLIQGGIGN
jgi:hypothetical protein